MAIRIYSITVTVPSGIQPTSPQVTSWFTEDAWVDTVEVEVPPGHNGLTGIRLTKSDVQILPWSNNTWFTVNDYTRVFPIDDYIPTGDLKIQAYNTGSYPHTFFLRMSVHTYDGKQAAPLQGAPALPETSGPAVSPDPLSPDQLLGPDAANALTSGQITAADVAPVTVTEVPVPSGPATTVA